MKLGCTTPLSSRGFSEEEGEMGMPHDKPALPGILLDALGRDVSRDLNVFPPYRASQTFGC